MTRDVKSVGLVLALLGLGLVVSLDARLASATQTEVPSLPAEMVLIPAGSFEMGDNLREGWDDEQPVHTVFVSAFCLDKYEVAKTLWDEVADWAEGHGYDIGPGDGSGKALDHPVQSVSWYDVAKWANARSEMEGLTPCYTIAGSVYRAGESDPECTWGANGYRLPTEAEWEKAARGGGEGHRFPWCDTDTIDHARANYDSGDAYSYNTSATRGYHPEYSNGPQPYTSPAGNFAANGYGLYDMAGNVWEWCWDWWSKSYYVSSPGTDPHGPESGSQRVVRGGSWVNFSYSCRVADRYDRPPDTVTDLSLGFRLVRTMP
jgi:sulfatase modifying factor 1